MTRAEPVAASYEQHLIAHVGTFADLEDELCSFDGTGSSPESSRRTGVGLTELGFGGGASDGVFV